MISREFPPSGAVSVPRPPLLTSLVRILSRRRVASHDVLFSSAKNRPIGSLQQAQRQISSTAKACVEVLTRLLAHEDIQNHLGWHRTDLLSTQVRNFNASLDTVVVLTTSGDDFVEKETRLALISITLLLAATIVHVACLLDKGWFNAKPHVFMADYMQTVDCALYISQIEIPWAEVNLVGVPSKPIKLTQDQRTWCERIIERGRFDEINRIFSIISDHSTWKKLSWSSRQQDALLMEVKAISVFFEQIQTICTRRKWNALMYPIPAGLLEKKANIKDLTSRADYHLSWIKPEVPKEVAKWMGNPLLEYSIGIDAPIIRVDLGQTGSWFIESKEYQSWYTSEAGSPQRFLWCLGGIGMGKTMLSHSVVATQMQRLGEPAFRPLPIFVELHFHHDEGVDAKDLLQCILQQVVRQMEVSTKLFILIYESLREGVVVACDVELLHNLLVEVTEYYPTYFFLDGLDECQPSTLHQVIDRLVSLGPHHHILCFSRPSLTTRQQAYPHFTFWPIQAHESDIKLHLDFIMEIVGVSPDRQLSTLEKAQVVETAISNSEGCFQLLASQIEAALSVLRPQKLTSAIQQIPEDAYDRYDYTMRRINQTSERRDVLYNIIAWVMVLEDLSVTKDLPRLLPAEDLATSFAQDLVDECLGILSLRGDKIIFSHYLSKAFISHRFSKLFPDFIPTTKSWLSSFNDDPSMKDLSTRFDRFTANQDGPTSDVASYLRTHRLAIES